MPKPSLAFLLIFVCLSPFFSSCKNETVWEPLLDSELSNWDTYLSYRHKNEYNGLEPKDDEGKPLKPLGYGENANNVFSVVQEKEELVLRISGEIYGCIFTKREFENYHLKMKVKWGEKKWPPRLNESMDSGILYHTQGKCGVDYWRSWMLSQEFQMIENSMGDYWSIANSQIDINASVVKDTNYHQFNPSANCMAFGLGTGNPNFCQSAIHVERPKGEWNELELICFGDKSLHLVNGQVVMALAHSRYMEGNRAKPLVKGKIQLQSEAAEVFFKDIYLRPINRIPESYMQYFK